MVRRRTSSGRLEESLEEEHEHFQELKDQSDKLNTQLEVHKPLVNLVDNLVTMGSLYGGDNLMLASQYKRVGGQGHGACNTVEVSLVVHTLTTQEEYCGHALDWIQAILIIHKMYLYM